MTGSARGARSTVVVLAAAGVTVSVMQTLIVPLIGELPGLLHAAPSDAAWAVTATLLSGAVVTPVLGRLGDLYGKRRLLLVSVALLVLGSLVCAPAHTLLPMIVGRALQGCGMGVIPLGISVMGDVLPRERLGSAIGVMSSSLGVGAGLGLPAAAAIAQNADWHLLFWGSAALGTVVFGLVAALVPESPARAPGR